MLYAAYVYRYRVFCALGGEQIRGDHGGKGGENIVETVFRERSADYRESFSVRTEHFAERFADGKG